MSLFRKKKGDPEKAGRARQRELDNQQWHKQLSEQVHAANQLAALVNNIELRLSLGQAVTGDEIRLALQSQPGNPYASSYVLDLQFRVLPMYRRDASGEPLARGGQ